MENGVKNHKHNTMIYKKNFKAYTKLELYTDCIFIAWKSHSFRLDCILYRHILSKHSFGWVLGSEIYTQ